MVRLTDRPDMTLDVYRGRKTTVQYNTIQSSVIRQSFFFFKNDPKDLDPSCKMDLDLLDCLGRVNLVL